MNKDFPQFNNRDNNNDYEIDVKVILNLILRNKIFIFSMSVIFFILACLYSLTRKRVWQGEFQIVLNQDSKEMASEALGLSGIAEIIGLGGSSGGSNSLKTEVGILESPSILRPVFDLVKNKRTESNPALKLYFKDWKKDNLGIKLKSSTSILNITYTDTDKEIIIPVLNKMTEVYQEYSGKAKRRAIELSKFYLMKEIDTYKLKSANSIKKAQNYAIDQDLTILNLSNSGGIDNNMQFNVNKMQFGPRRTFNFDNVQLGDNISVEVARVKAANEIRRIDIQIKKIQSLDDNNEDLQYISLIVPETQKEGLPADLRDIDLKILELKTKYTDEYKPLKNLEERRGLLVKLLKERAIGFLKAQRISAESDMESARRPKGVLLKYKEFIREAKRDEQTLIQLENALRASDLEQAKIEDPWKLITAPTLQDIPIAPNRKRIGGFGIIFGIFAGILLSILKEKRSGIIYDERSLELLLNSKIIEKINLNSNNFESVKDDLILNQFLISNIEKTFKFFIEPSTAKLNLDKFEKFIIEKKQNISIIKKLSDINKNEIIILVTKIPSLKEDDIENINKKLSLIQNQIFGIILID